MAGMMAQTIATDRPQFMTDGVPTLFAATDGEPVSAAQMQWVVGLALQASPLATLACLRGFGRNDFRRELGALTMPTLVIHGDLDGVAADRGGARGGGGDSGSPLPRVRRRAARDLPDRADAARGRSRRASSGEA